MTLWRKIERGVRDTLGEGALWCERDGAFYWVDILAPALNRMTLADGEITRWGMPAPLGWVAQRASGGLIGGFRDGVAAISLDPLGVAPRHDPEPHLPGNRMNDGKADRHGAIWCGTMEMAEENATGSFYRLSPDGEWQVIDTGYTVTNGPAFSPCGTWLYHTDSGRRTIYRFPFDANGTGLREEFIRFSEEDGYPDGMTTDAEGFLWVAHWDGGRISRFAPDGTRDRSIELPAKRITNIAFAGEKLDRMFVTSASKGLPESEFDGALFEVESGVVGNPAGTYLG
ncbi:MULTISPECIES: SMP-30/gluconolactonase/LRE family protein [unclassified Novosphingobium]|uniref:SMP-30/gluconolactonase/LRE family protein n=1 Tax=unclassified Novosphingobium TaxID=2644732 RepID=UPI001359EBA7|nr:MULTISPECIES: SMP-30/gluconolactonase/LRE family protein [unclassified Novosphingobium]